MPYKMVKRDGKFCVMNADTGDNKGCSDTHAMAIKHMRALYAAEGGAKMGKKELDNLTIKSYFNFINDPDNTDETLDTEALAEGLADEAQAAEIPTPQPAETEVQTPETISTTAVTDTTTITSTSVQPFTATTTVTIPAAEPLPGEAEKRDLTGADISDSFFERVIQKVKSFFGFEDESDQALMVWKENGTYRWLTRYSNNFLDDDNPREIIAEQSHRLFEQDIDKGLAPYPELWLWHVPEWKLGQADWLAWDDSGFALAAGHFYPGREAQAEWLSKQKGWAVSHGMPTDSIERDATNPNIIIRHRTREISPLPLTAAANKRTGYVVLKETPMAIPDEKKKALIEKWGLKPELLAELESLNAEDAKKAVDAGVDRKEQTAEQTPPAVPEKQVETPATPADPPVTRQEIADAIATVVVPQIDAANKGISDLIAVVDGLKKELETLKQADEEKIIKQAATIPQASLAALMFQRVIGNDKTAVSLTDPLANSKPKEVEAPKGTTGIPFIDSMISGSK